MRRLLASLALVAAASALEAGVLGSVEIGTDYTNLVVSGSSAESLSLLVSNRVAGVVREVSGDFTEAFALETGVDYGIYTNGVLADAVTAASLADGPWFAESGATIGDPAAGTGLWTADTGVSVSASGAKIVISQASDADDGVCATFTPTNGFPAASPGCLASFRTAFNLFSDPQALPSAAEHKYGVTAVETDEGDILLEVILDGAWVAVPSAVFVPVREREYDFEVMMNGVSGKAGATYFVTDVETGVRTALARTASGDGTHPSSMSFYGEGSLENLEGRAYDTALVHSDIVLDGLAWDGSLTAGSNFTNLLLSGTVTLTNRCVTTLTGGKVVVGLTDATGGVRTVWSGTWNGFDKAVAFTNLVEGLPPGDSYTVSVEVVPDDTSRADRISGETESVVASVTGRGASGYWIDEDADTFLKRRDASGVWTATHTPFDEAAVMSNGVLGTVISINTELSSQAVFQPTDDSDTVVNSTVREIRFELCSEAPSFYVSKPSYAPSSAGDIAGFAIACDDTDGEKLHFAVYSPDGGGTWKVLPDTTAELNARYVVIVVFDYANPNRSAPDSVSYYLEDAEGRRTFIGSVQPEGGLPEVTGEYVNKVRFVGSAELASMKGLCYDAHLAAVDGDEYWTVADAIDSIGSTGRVLEPLWYARHEMSGAGANFGVRDPNGYLTLTWPVGYIVVRTVDGDVVYYYCYLSDWWRDWADASGVVETADGYDVLTANGLAYLMRESTNGWLRGAITLKHDITNLLDHVWTPIEGFEGVFDGEGHVITGLRNGAYAGGPTNALGLSAYGLFATASNSVFRNVALEAVAVTNGADAVAALLGCSVGDLAITNVTLRSGVVEGGGTFVAGLVGYMGDFGKVSLAANTNAASVANVLDDTMGLYAAGIANLGGNAAGVPGAVIAAANENRGALASTITSAVGGGNVAQILAGTDPEAQFAAAAATGNVGTGGVARVVSLNHSASPVGPLPVVNLAAEVTRQTDEEGYHHFIEANDATVAVVDPHYRTARMTAAFYQDGTTNEAGRVNDLITASADGDTVTLPGGVEAWSPIVLDRPITLNLGGQVVDDVFENYAFDVREDAEGATVMNGTVVAKAGLFATYAPGGMHPNWTTNDVVFVPWNCDSYWDRTFYVNGDFENPVALSVPMLTSMLAAGASIAPVAGSAYSVDPASDAILLGGAKAVSLARLGYTLATRVEDGNTVYVVELDDDPATLPAISLSATPVDGAVKAVLTGTRADCEYCLKCIGSLAEDWASAPADWRGVENDGDELTLEAEATGDSGFYRIETRRK